MGRGESGGGGRVRSSLVDCGLRGVGDLGLSDEGDEAGIHLYEFGAKALAPGQRDRNHGRLSGARMEVTRVQELQPGADLVATWDAEDSEYEQHRAELNARADAAVAKTRAEQGVLPESDMRSEVWGLVVGLIVITVIVIGSLVTVVGQWGDRAGYSESYHRKQ